MVYNLSKCNLLIIFSDIPELSAIIGEPGSSLQASDEAGIQSALRQCFKALMTCPTEMVHAQLTSLVERHNSLGTSFLSVSFYLHLML